jgi:PKD repeat protein
LTYWWSLTTKPAGSPTILSDPTAIQPSFVLDRPGTYAAQLLVSDGALDSAPDTVTVSTLNVKPVADAGSDQYRRVGDVVMLDGFRSSDPDGDALTYEWSIITRPAGSTTNLQTSTVMRPSFILDRPGAYTLQLIVSDGQVDSDPDTVLITTENTKPVANAGPDRNGQPGVAIVLDGRASYDADGDLLTYAWSLIGVPPGGPVILTNPTSVQPTFTSSLSGIYLAQLIVSDGTTSSDPSTVFITVGVGGPPPINQPPIANAGPDQTIRLGQILQLDGSGSFDPENDPLLYQWALVSAPAGPAAFLQANGARLTFQAQTAGTYIVQLLVNDGTVNSAPDQVTITVSNTANVIPVANAGPDQAVTPGTTVQLNGSGSQDTNGDALTYEWRLTLKPTGSAAVLNSVTSISPTFRADVVGTYIAQLIVSDGFSSSTPDTVTITAGIASDTTPPLPADLTRIGLSDIVGGQVTVTGVSGAVEGSTRVTLTNLRTNLAVNVTASSSGSFTARLTVQAGDLISIVMTDATGNVSPARTLQVTANIQVTITAPTQGASIFGNRVRVSGTVQGPLNTGVVVNGVVALVYNGVFIAEDVALVGGQNTITATATPLGGPSVQNQITVTSDEAPILLEVEASPTSGIAPLEVTFTYQFGSTTPIQSLSIDFDGNGTFDFTTTDPNTLLQHTYTVPGLYLARLRVTTSQGQSYEAESTIAVQDAATMDTLFKSMWNTMNAALVAGDIPTALMFLDSAAQEKYGPVWQVLLPHMAEIVSSYSPVQALFISSGIAEYGLNRTINEENRLFLIYFLKNDDGVWRINVL